MDIPDDVIMNVACTGESSPLAGQLAHGANAAWWATSCPPGTTATNAAATSPPSSITGVSWSRSALPPLNVGASATTGSCRESVVHAAAPPAPVLIDALM